MPLLIRADAVYCSDRCSQNAYQRRRRLGEKPPAPPLPEALATFERDLAGAPSQAIGYRLGIRQRSTGPLVWFPPAGKLTKRWSGQMSRRPYFSLNPWEPPRVPVVGVYAVEFIGADGQVIANPPRFELGLYVPFGISSIQSVEGR